MMEELDRQITAEGVPIPLDPAVLDAIIDRPVICGAPVPLLAMTEADCRNGTEPSPIKGPVVIGNPL